MGQWYVDITAQFEFIFERFTYCVEWTKIHGVIIAGHMISFFDLAIGVFCVYLLSLFIPIFDDDPIDEKEREEW